MKITQALIAASIIAWLLPTVGFAFQAAIQVDPATNTSETLAESHPLHPKFQLQRLRSQIETMGQVRQRVLDQLEIEFESEVVLEEQITALDEKLAKFEFVAEEGIVTQLMAKRIELMIDIAGLNARQEAKRGIGNDNNSESEAKGLSQQQTRKHPAIEKLKQQREIHLQLLHIEQQKLAGIKTLHERGAASSANLADSESQVLLAKMKLLELEEKIETTVLVGTPNHSVSADSLQLAEKQSQLEVVNRLLQQVATSRPILAKRNELQTRLNRIRSARQEGIAQAIRDWEAGYTKNIFQAEFLSQNLSEEFEGIND